MAPESRPPSEQTAEFRALDLLEQLTAKVDELAKRPVIVPVHANWWDVLPTELREISGRSGMYTNTILPTQRGDRHLLLGVQQLDDRIELQLRLDGGWTIWQRALFYGEGPRA